MRIDEFNALDAESARELLTVCAAVPTWVEALVAGRPYASVVALAEAARRAAAEWTTADLDMALAHHPRIGERAAGDGAEATASAREQAAMATAADEVARAIAEGNAAYEARFGRVFLIRAAGRSPQEILAELQRRLVDDDESEASQALEELAQIALLRLRTTVTDAATERSTA